MRLIIAGSRGINDMNILLDALRLNSIPLVHPVTEVVSGMCQNSPDMLGLEWAKGKGIPVKEMPADWRDRDNIKDPSAGRRRNVAMAKYADQDDTGALLAVMYTSGSPGTKHMIQAARSRGLKVFIHKVPG